MKLSLQMVLDTVSTLSDPPYSPTDYEGYPEKPYGVVLATEYIKLLPRKMIYEYYDFMQETYPEKILKRNPNTRLPVLIDCLVDFLAKGDAGLE